MFAQSAFDRLSKDKRNATVEKMVEEATSVLEEVADKSWVPWAKRLIPNVALRAKERAAEREREEHTKKVREEAGREAERVAQRKRRMEEKLEAFVEGKMTEEEFERDSEVEAEAEGDEAVGTEEVEESGRMETSAMEVDEGGESEVVTAEKGKRSGGRKRAPSSPPKQLRKRARATTAMQMTAGSQARTESTGSVGIRCERCIRQGIMCMAVDGGARCANCKAKHYRCSLVVGKEVPRGKGGPSGSQLVRSTIGSQTKGKAKRGKSAKVAKGVALSGLTLGECQ